MAVFAPAPLPAAGPTTYLTDGIRFAIAGGLYSVMQVASFAGRIVVGVTADRLGSPRKVLIAPPSPRPAAPWPAPPSSASPPPP